jgi:hypothetical protein
MVEPVAGPGLEPPDHRDTAAAAPWVQGQGLSCRRGGAQQEVVDRLLVTTCNGSEFSRACAGHHAVRDWQQQPLLVVQPGVGLAMLALGTLPVLTGVGAVMVVSACVTVRELAAKHLRAARRKVVPGAKRRGAHPVATLSSVVGAMEAAAVSDLDQHRSLMRRWMAGDPRSSALTVSWVERRVVVGEACPRDACMSRSLPPAASRWVAQRWRSG